MQGYDTKNYLATFSVYTSQLKVYSNLKGANRENTATIYQKITIFCLKTTWKTQCILLNFAL